MYKAGSKRTVLQRHRQISSTSGVGPNKVGLGSASYCAGKVHDQIGTLAQCFERVSIRQITPDEVDSV